MIKLITIVLLAFSAALLACLPTDSNRADMWLDAYATAQSVFTAVLLWSWRNDKFIKKIM